MDKNTNKKQKKKTAIQIRCSESDRDRWKEFADKWADGNLSRFVKMAIRDFAINKEKEQENKQRKEIAEREYKKISEKIDRLGEQLKHLDEQTRKHPSVTGIVDQEKLKAKILHIFEVKSHPLEWNELVREAQFYEIDEDTLDQILTELKSQKILFVNGRGRHELSEH